MNKNKIPLITCLIYGIINFAIFSYDIEHDRDFMTWMWLLSSILSFMLSIMFYIKYKLSNHE